MINIMREMKDMIHRLLENLITAHLSPQDLTVVEKAHQHSPLDFTSAGMGKPSIPGTALRLEHRTGQRASRQGPQFHH